MEARAGLVRLGGRGHGPGQGHSGTPEWRGVKEWLPEGHRDGWEKSGTRETWLDLSVPAWGVRNGPWQPGPHPGLDPNHQPSTEEPLVTDLEELDAYICASRECYEPTLQGSPLTRMRQAPGA